MEAPSVRGKRAPARGASRVHRHRPAPIAPAREAGAARIGAARSAVGAASGRGRRPGPPRPGRPGPDGLQQGPGAGYAVRMSDLPSSRIPALDHVYERVQWLAYPLVRIATGSFLVPHGAQKLFGFAGGSGATAAGFGLVPASPLASLVGAIEFFGGLCIALGVFTRPAALAAAVPLAFAALVVHRPNGFFWTAGGLEYPLMWTLLCVACVLRGSGPLSIDAARGRDA